jgi:hypothetical protein
VRNARPRSVTPRLALRKSEVAEALGVSDDYLADHVWPELRLVRRGRLTLCPVTELQRWLEQNAARVLSDDARLDHNYNHLRPEGR